MATKSSKTKVTRISASDSSAPKKTKKTSPVARSSKAAETRKPRSLGPLTGILAYFKGAWTELRQVHWPTRKATWGLTGAVLIFSAFFVVFITALDAGFKFLFEQLLK